MCTRLTGFYHVKSYPTKGVTFSHQDSLRQFSGFWGDRRKKEVGDFGKSPAFNNFAKSCAKEVMFSSVTVS